MVKLHAKTLFSFFLTCLFLGWPGAFAQEGNPSANLERIVAQIDALLPRVEGIVLAVEKNILTLDLKQGQPIQTGDTLKLIRYGEPIVHPVTKKTVGRKETDLGMVEIIDVRKDFSLARGAALKETPKPGDGVRSEFKKIALLIAPPEVESRRKVDALRLKTQLEQQFSRHPRFEVPAFDLELWMLENGLNRGQLLQPQALEKLGANVQADFILATKFVTVKDRSVLRYRLHSAKDGSIRKKAQVLTGPLPETPAVSRKPTREREQEVQSNFAPAEGLLVYAGKQELDFEVVDLDVGDINGDGTEEVVLIDRHRILVYQVQDNAFKRIAQIKTKKGINRFLGVDLADINGNGREEIFITNQMDSKLESFVLELDAKNRKPQKIWKDVNFYFRVIHPLGSPARLMAQSPGFRDPFHGPIRWIEFKNNTYVEGSELKLPDIYGTEFILYGMTQSEVNEDGHMDTIILDTDYHLRVYSASGRLLVKSNDYYGHDPRLIDVGVTEDVAGVVTQGEPVHFKGRLEFTRLGDKRYLLLPKNHRLGGNWLSRAVVIENSSLVVLNVTAEGFEKVFETKKQKGYLAAYQVMNMQGSSDKKVFVATVVNEGLFRQKRSTVFIYNWKSR